jgi:hypothetical protein
VPRFFMSALVLLSGYKSLDLIAQAESF